MLFSGYEATMLAFEANGVIGLRSIKIARGGVDAVQEINLMVQEKFDAAAEALTTLVGGGSVEAILSGYRRRDTQCATAVPRKEDAMNKELEGHDSPALDQSGEPPNPRNVQGEALQMNDNSAGGKKPVSSQLPNAAEPNPHKGQGKALQVNENTAGE
jgi:hypothetical protein